MLTTTVNGLSEVVDETRNEEIRGTEICELVSDQKTWLTNEFWPIPKWLEKSSLVEQYCINSSITEFDDFQEYSAMLNKVIDNCVEPSKVDAYRDAYDRVTFEMNRENINQYINYGLQIKRLKKLRLGSEIILFLIILFAPILLNSQDKSIQL